MELDAAGDLIVYIDPGTDYIAEKDLIALPVFKFEEHVVVCQDQRKSAII